MTKLEALIKAEEIAVAEFDKHMAILEAWISSNGECAIDDPQFVNAQKAGNAMSRAIGRRMQCEAAA